MHLSELSAHLGSVHFIVCKFYSKEEKLYFKNLSNICNAEATRGKMSSIYFEMHLLDNVRMTDMIGPSEQTRDGVW